MAARQTVPALPLELVPMQRNPHDAQRLRDLVKNDALTQEQCDRVLSYRLCEGEFEVLFVQSSHQEPPWAIIIGCIDDDRRIAIAWAWYHSACEDVKAQVEARDGKKVPTKARRGR
jgi:hypothetical protein